MSVRVVAPCRLHFGLFHVPVDGLTHHPDGRPVRKFGGLGLMIDEPCVTVEATETGQPTVTGPLASRAGQIVATFRNLGTLPTIPHSFRADGPPEHTGLGVGTALSLSIASVLLTAYWEMHYVIPTTTLAWCVGRGRRSGIGIDGFRDGGFLVDNGKVTDDELPQLAARLDFPASWRIVFVRPPVPPVWYGDRERGAFARTRPADRALALTDHLRTLAYDIIVPAVRNADFDTFATSIAAFNRMAGEPFVHDQGGPYAGAEVACVIDELMEMGAVGVGQSSWGPTVFAFCESEDEAEKLAVRARERFSSATEVIVTRANNTGARVEQL